MDEARPNYLQSQVGNVGLGRERKAGDLLDALVGVGLTINWDDFVKHEDPTRGF